MVFTGLAQSEDEIPLVCANHTKPLTDTIGNAINSTDNCESLNCPKDHVCMPDFDRYYCCNKEAEGQHRCIIIHKYDLRNIDEGYFRVL